MSVKQVRQVNWKEFNKRSDELLKELQKTLLPDHADEVIAIEVESGGYVLGKTPTETALKFWEQFPDKLMFLVRVDGGAVVKYHNRVKR
ncbi:hypothetical protein HYR99_37875 [Candidatus Poribacteria bacterium]|nr:hypothetical protein [Candidatus Poribacteria bacterium]